MGLIKVEQGGGYPSDAGSERAGIPEDRAVVGGPVTKAEGLSKLGVVGPSKDHRDLPLTGGVVLGGDPLEQSEQLVAVEGLGAITDLKNDQIPESKDKVRLG